MAGPSLCAKCGKRKAKRACPSLGRSLCNLCCGLLREKDLHCPPSCRYLSEHKPYQERRILERPAGRGLSPGDEDLRDERLAWLALSCQTALLEASGRNPEFLDRDAVLALEYAREKAAKGPGLLIIPGQSRRPVNEAGELILKAAETCRYETKTILSSGLETYQKEEILRVLGRLIKAVKDAAGSDLEGRLYLEALEERLNRIRQASREKRLITLG